MCRAIVNNIVHNYQKINEKKLDFGYLIVVYLQFNNSITHEIKRKK